MSTQDSTYVRTQHGLIIEFQHSHLDPQEQAAREIFYKNMVWVVDGMRLKKDPKRFLKGINGRRALTIQGFFLLAFPEECFPAAWLKSSVPVLFDFLDTDTTDSPNPMNTPLWCLLPGRAEGNAIIVEVSHKQFVEIASSRPLLLPFPAHEIVSACAHNIRQQRAIEVQREQRLVYGHYMRKPRQWRF